MPRSLAQIYLILTLHESRYHLPLFKEQLLWKKIGDNYLNSYQTNKHMSINTQMVKKEKDNLNKIRAQIHAPFITTLEPNLSLYYWNVCISFITFPFPDSTPTWAEEIPQENLLLLNFQMFETGWPRNCNVSIRTLSSFSLYSPRDPGRSPPSRCGKQHRYHLYNAALFFVYHLALEKDGAPKGCEMQ